MRQWSSRKASQIPGPASWVQTLSHSSHPRDVGKSLYPCQPQSFRWPRLGTAPPTSGNCQEKQGRGQSPLPKKRRTWVRIENCRVQETGAWGRELRRAGERGADRSRSWREATHYTGTGEQAECHFVHLAERPTGTPLPTQKKKSSGRQLTFHLGVQRLLAI